MRAYKLFAVNWGGKPLLVCSTLSEELAVDECEESRQMGSYEKRGYADRGDNFEARLATSDECQSWVRAAQAAIDEGALDDMTDAERGYIAFVADPENEPPAAGDDAIFAEQEAKDATKH